jgi:hypothetical protein
LNEEENVLHPHCGLDVVWSGVNTAESVIGVQTPLSGSFWDDGGERGFRRADCELGFLPPTALAIPDRVEEKFTAIFYGLAATPGTTVQSSLASWASPASSIPSTGLVDYAAVRDFASTGAAVR